MSKWTAAVVLIALAVFVGWLISTQRPHRVIAYVASADRKVFAVDLLGGTVLRESEAVDGMGRPSSIAYLAPDSLLFITSERGRGQNDYYPLIAVSADGLDVVKTYTLDTNRERSLRNDAPNFARVAAYSVVGSPNGRTLYLGLGESSGALTTVFDAVTGTVTGRTNVPIQPGNYLSPDGDLVAEVWPSGSRTVEEGDRLVVREWPGGVVVHDIRTGDVVSRTELTGNRGLNPPWASEPGPYLYIKPGTSQLAVYDRATGEPTSNIDLHALTGMTLAQTDILAIPKSTFAAVSMVDAEGRGFVMVIDTSSEQVRSRIPVGPWPTNPVLASGPR